MSTDWQWPAAIERDQVIEALDQAEDALRRWLAGAQYSRDNEVLATLNRTRLLAAKLRRHGRKAAAEQPKAARPTPPEDDVWLPRIERWLAHNPQLSSVVLGDVMRGALGRPPSQWTQKGSRRVIVVIEQLGWTPERVPSGYWRWLRPATPVAVTLPPQADNDEWLARIELWLAGNDSRFIALDDVLAAMPPGEPGYWPHDGKLRVKAALERLGWVYKQVRLGHGRAAPRGWRWVKPAPAPVAAPPDDAREPAPQAAAGA